MSKPAMKFYPTLDLLRGVAALVVVLYHERIGFNMMGALAPSNIAGHGYLAVDFFFQLSGFIIAASYDERLRNGMSVAAFARVRLVRLYPLIFASLVLGLFAYSLPTEHAVPDEGTAFVKELFFVPTYARGSNVFPLNFPQWSIIFELGVNLFMAVCFHWLTNRRILSIVAASLVVTVTLSIYKGSFDFGAGYPGFPAGLPRTIMSFFAGVLIFRNKHLFSNFRMHPLFAALVLLVVMMGPIPKAWGWQYSVFAVVFIFPMLIAHCAVVGRGTWLDKALGTVSYPIYVVHAPTLVICIAVANALGLDVASTAFGLTALGAVLGMAVLALKAWDEPVRGALSSQPKRWLVKQ